MVQLRALLVCSTCSGVLPVTVFTIRGSLMGRSAEGEPLKLQHSRRSDRQRDAVRSVSHQCQRPTKESTIL